MMMMVMMITAPVTAVAWSGDMYIDDDDGDDDNSSCDSCCMER